MVQTGFDRDEMARWYAVQHMRTDPGIGEVYYLPTGAPDHEIRLIEINSRLTVPLDELEPVDFSVDAGDEVEHSLFVLDVTPEQWKRIQANALTLPATWSLTDAKEYRS